MRRFEKSIKHSGMAGNALQNHLTSARNSFILVLSLMCPTTNFFLLFQKKITFLNLQQPPPSISLPFSANSPSSNFSKANNRIDKFQSLQDQLVLDEGARLGGDGSAEVGKGRQEGWCLGVEQRSSMGFGLKLIEKLALYNQQHHQMALRKQSPETKRRYAKISLKKREMLVELVIRQGCGLAKTAKKLNLKLSTAKLILRKYKQTGKFHIRRVRTEPTGNPLQAHHVKQQDLIPSLSQEQEYSLSRSKEEQPIPTPNFYPMVYADMSFPYLAFYGVWPVANYYQFK